MFYRSFHSLFGVKPKVFTALLCFVSLLIFTRCEDQYDDLEDTVEEEAYEVACVDIVTENEVEVSTRETYVACDINIESDKSEWNYSGSGKIRGRGNSTWLWYPKKPYRIKLDEKAEILGLSSDKDWVLLADYRDPTHLMNAFVFIVGQEVGLPYTNHIRYVEVTLNGEYIGLYSLTEQVEEGKNRVAIDEDQGILLSLDADDGPYYSPDATDNFWSTVYEMPVCIKNPDDLSSSQISEIKNEFGDLEEAIKSADYDAVDELMDISSFIDYMIIQELVYNVEVDAPRSIYMYKDVGERWVMGPLWDFDAGFDFDWSTMYTGHTYFSSYKELVLGTSPVYHTGGYSVPSFFTDLFKSKRFLAEYKKRWLNVKDKIMSDYWTTAQLYADGFSEAIVRDADCWPIDMDNETQINKMEQWLTNRIDYLSDVIDNYPAGTID